MSRRQTQLTALTAWLQKNFFGAASRLTAILPKSGARILDAAIYPLIGSRLLATLLARRNRRVMSGIGSFERFLIIPDIHIGDAVMTQSALAAVRDFFPEARVDYLVNKTAFPLIDGNPEATRVIPFFSGGSFPPAETLAALRRLARTEGYDLVLNFCPFIEDTDIRPGRRGILNLMTNASAMVRAERDRTQVNHFIHQGYLFTRAMLSLAARPVRGAGLAGARLTLSDTAVEQAWKFMSAAGLPSGLPLIIYNPDAASPYTRMPFEKQQALLARLAGRNAVLLVNEGHTDAGVGRRLLASLVLPPRAKAAVIPAALSLEAYAALLDLADAFVSADTGPLHLAAARKFSRSGRHAFRNRTAVLSFFGATPARMSGYDSSQPGYLPANQDAPSWAYTAGSPCRNITCLNKMYKTCRKVRCFEDVDIEGLAGRVSAYLETRLPHPSRPGRPATA